MSEKRADKLKGFRKLDKYLTNWCNSNGFNVRCRLSTDFGFNSDKKIINYALVVPEADNKIYNDIFMKYLTHVKECDSFILSFFHELGHYMTEDEFDDWEWCDYYDFTQKFENKKKLTKADYKRYFYHPIEFNASMWGVEFINNNVDLISDFFNGFSKELKEFAKKNRIELE